MKERIDELLKFKHDKEKEQRKQDRQANSELVSAKKSLAEEAETNKRLTLDLENVKKEAVRANKDAEAAKSELEGKWAKILAEKEEEYKKSFADLERECKTEIETNKKKNQEQTERLKLKMKELYEHSILTRILYGYHIFWDTYDKAAAAEAENKRKTLDTEPVDNGKRKTVDAQPTEVCVVFGICHNVYFLVQEKQRKRAKTSPESVEALPTTPVKPQPPSAPVTPAPSELSPLTTTNPTTPASPVTPSKSRAARIKSPAKIPEEKQSRMSSCWLKLYLFTYWLVTVMLSGFKNETERLIVEKRIAELGWAVSQVKANALLLFFSYFFPGGIR